LLLSQRIEAYLRWRRTSAMTPEPVTAVAWHDGG